MPGGLFWRTFMLIGLLMALSLTSFVLAFRALEVGPRGEQFALHIASIVNTTRAAIQHSAPEYRRALLLELAQNEAIRVYPLEPDDVVEPLPPNALNDSLLTSLHRRMPADTLVGGEVNGISGFWVSFTLDEDRYWVAIARDRFERLPGVEWVFWGTAAVLLSLIGAAMIVALVNQPLARLGRAALQLSRGQAPPRLPPSNLREIRLVNDAFNRMVEDLQRIEADRALILAGISHDLRTPLARLALEVELSPASEETKQAMSADISQMDKIVAQFLDYARPRSVAAETVVDLSSIVHAQADAVERQGAIVKRQIADGLQVRGHETELTRAITNIIDNARKYGSAADGVPADIEVWLRKSSGQVVLEVLDKGPGVPAADIERIKRPFTRANEARSQASGAGLGLAIVERVVTRAGGRWSIANRSRGGLAVTLQLPAA
ncbi:ATP-binding protein [soil metagenome]